MLKEVITIKKILFGITSLTLGGAERVLVDISNKLSEKYDITIFSIYDNGELKNDLNKNVKFKALYNCRYDELTKLQKMWIPIKILLFSKIIYNKKIKQNYDTEIAFLEGPITRLFSTKNKDVHKIAWIHNDIEKVFGNDLKSKIKKYIDVDEKDIDVRLTNKTNEDGTTGAPALYANIPIAGIREEMKKEKNMEKEVVANSYDCAVGSARDSVLGLLRKSLKNMISHN